MLSEKGRLDTAAEENSNVHPSYQTHRIKRRGSSIVYFVYYLVKYI